MVREGLLRDPRCAQEREPAESQEGLPQARPAAPSRHERGQSRRRGTVQGGLRGLRRARRGEEARELRPGARDGRRRFPGRLSGLAGCRLSRRRVRRLSGRRSFRGRGGRSRRPARRDVRRCGLRPRSAPPPRRRPRDRGHPVVRRRDGRRHCARHAERPRAVHDVPRFGCGAGDAPGDVHDLWWVRTGRRQSGLLLDGADLRHVPRNRPGGADALPDLRRRRCPAHAPAPSR